MKSRTKRRCLLPAVAWVAATALGGCGGNGNGVPGGQAVYGPDVTPSNGPVAAGPTTPPGLNPYTLGRSFVKLNGNVPTEVGFELTDDGILDQPPTPISDDQPNVYIVPLPAQFTQVGQISPIPFKAIAVFYFTGHPINTNPSDPNYRPNGEPQHFHIVFLVNPPRQPDPPNFPAELTPVAPAEDPVGAPEAQPPTVVPGFGVSYDDPTKPAGQPPRVTTGQNFLFYNGHMNGIVVGEKVSVLLDRGSENDSILQPKVYPAPGYFPHRWNVRYDPVRHVHVFSLSDFQSVGASYITQGP